MTPQQIKAKIAMIELAIKKTDRDYADDIDLLTNQLTECEKSTQAK